MLNQAEDRAHRIGQKNSVNIYYMHGRGTIDDQIFQLLNDKALVTSDITDGFKATLNLNRQGIDDIQLTELGKDGTVERKNPQKSLESFFAKKKTNEFNTRDKSMKSAGPEVVEGIEESDNEN